MASGSDYEGCALQDEVLEAFDWVSAGVSASLLEYLICRANNLFTVLY